MKKIRNAHWMSIYAYEDNNGGPMSKRLEMQIKQFNQEVKGFVDLFNFAHRTNFVVDSDWESDSYPAEKDKK